MFKFHSADNFLRVLKLLILAIITFGVLGLANYSKADDFLDPDEAFVFSAAMADPLTLDVHYEIAPDYYMYQERFEVKLTDADGQLLLLRESTLFPEESPQTPVWQNNVLIPQGAVTYDPTFEKNMEVFHKQVGLRIPLNPGANGPIDVSITSQGCADSGLCYPPLTETFSLETTTDGYRAVGDKIKLQVPAPILSVVDADQTNTTNTELDILNLGDMGMAAWLHNAELWQILLLSLVFGALLSLTPCVLPMVPILLAVIAGQTTTVSRFRGFLLAAVYVFGMSIVYTLLGIAAGLMGAGLAAWLQSPWVLGSFAILLAIFALAMLDVFTLQAPVGMQSSLQNFMQKMPGGQIGSVFLMGMLSALIVGPCVAAPLAGILLFISQTGDVFIGGTSLFAMAWGEGLLLLIVGAGAGALIPKAGAWMNTLKYAFGILLLATAWWMARPLIFDNLYVGGWVLLGIWLALLIWHACCKSINESSSIGALFLRSVSVLIMVWALAVLVGLLAGKADLLKPLSGFTGNNPVSANNTQVQVSAQAIRDRFTKISDLADLDQQLSQTKQPVMLDFYADWCVSCLEMEKFTFSDPLVAQQMSEFLLLQADVTKMTQADKDLLARFNLFGPPGIIFFDRQGLLLADKRVVGFKNAKEFSAYIAPLID